MLTYKQAFDLITEAYIKGEMEPYKCDACFVGNLLGKTSVWAACASYHSGVRSRHQYTEFAKRIPHLLKQYNEKWYEARYLLRSNGYTQKNIFDIETNFLKVIDDNTCKLGEHCLGAVEVHTTHDNYENALFLAMESTLELLKKIHIARGEKIEETPLFTKRKKKPVVCA